MSKKPQNEQIQRADLLRPLPLYPKLKRSRQWTYNEYTDEDIMDDEGGPLMFVASKWDPQKPAGYIADIGIGRNRLIMPKGILVFLGYEAGYIDWIDCTVPLDGVSFAQAMRLCGEIAAMFEHIGFKSKRIKSKRIYRFMKFLSCNLLHTPCCILKYIPLGIVTCFEQHSFT